MKNIIIASVVMISGCATSTSTHLPDGEMGHSIDCSGEFLNWGDCEVEAGKLCGDAGYTVITKGTDEAVVTEGDVKRTLLIKCGVS